MTNKPLGWVWKSWDFLLAINGGEPKPNLKAVGFNFIDGGSQIGKR